MILTHSQTTMVGQTFPVVYIILPVGVWTETVFHSTWGPFVLRVSYLIKQIYKVRPQYLWFDRAAWY